MRNEEPCHSPAPPCGGKAGDEAQQDLPVASDRVEDAFHIVGKVEKKWTDKWSADDSRDHACIASVRLYTDVVQVDSQIANVKYGQVLSKVKSAGSMV